MKQSTANKTATFLLRTSPLTQSSLEVMESSKLTTTTILSGTAIDTHNGGKYPLIKLNT